MYFWSIPAMKIMTAMKKMKTKAVPRSGCNNINAIGRNAKIRTLTSTAGLFKSSLLMSMNLETEIITPNFANSDG